MTEGHFVSSGVMAPMQSYGHPNSSEVALDNIDKTDHYQTTTKHRKAWTVAPFTNIV